MSTKTDGNEAIVGCGVILALPFLVGLMLWIGWNYGVVEVVDGMRPLGFWPCVALVVMAMGTGACVRLLFKGWAMKGAE